MNQVVLIGRLTKDPELRKTETGKSIARFTLAVDKYEDKADFINCIVWGKSAENLCKYVSKGSQIALSGRIQTRTYDDAKGNKQYITEVVAESIEFLGSKRREETEYDVVQNTRKETNPFEDFKEQTKANWSEDIDLSDRLPF